MFKVPAAPAVSKRPKQDYAPVTSQYQPTVFNTLPAGYWSTNNTNKENATDLSMIPRPPPPYFAHQPTVSSSSTVSMSSDHMVPRDVFFQHPGTPNAMKMLQGSVFPGVQVMDYGSCVNHQAAVTLSNYNSLGVDSRPTYVMPSYQPQQQMSNLPPPPPYYAGVKFAQPAPQMMAMGSGPPSSASTSSVSMSAAFPMFPRSMAQTMVTVSNQSTPSTSMVGSCQPHQPPVYSAIHHHLSMTARGAQDLGSLQLPNFGTSDDTQMISTDMMSMSEFSSNSEGEEHPHFVLHYLFLYLNPFCSSRSR